MASHSHWRTKYVGEPLCKENQTKKRATLKQELYEMREHNKWLEQQVERLFRAKKLNYRVTEKF